MVIVIAKAAREVWIEVDVFLDASNARKKEYSY